jgi:hypothetical protein
MPNTSMMTPAMRITAAFILIATEEPLLFFDGILIHAPGI